MSNDNNETIISAVQKVQEADAEKARKALGLPKPQKPVSIDNAVADMKRQLAKESKNNLIRQWIGLYAQVVQLAQENEKLKSQLKLKTEASASANNEANASEGDSK
jgi:hypothetical protein